MKQLMRYILTAFMLLACAAAYAQVGEKEQSYYDSHPAEILPDAQAAFSAGNYELTLELCKWHYIITGSRSATSLRDKATQCSALAIRKRVVDKRFWRAPL